jgi:hypothetical protein
LFSVINVPYTIFLKERGTPDEIGMGITKKINDTNQVLYPSCCAMCKPLFRREGYDTLCQLLLLDGDSESEISHCPIRKELQE